MNEPRMAIRPMEPARKAFAIHVLHLLRDCNPVDLPVRIYEAIERYDKYREGQINGLFEQLIEAISMRPPAPIIISSDLTHPLGKLS